MVAFTEKVRVPPAADCRFCSSLSAARRKSEMLEDTARLSRSTFESDPRSLTLTVAG